VTPHQFAAIKNVSRRATYWVSACQNAHSWFPARQKQDSKKAPALTRPGLSLGGLDFSIAVSSSG
jgi:hypothetical protein